jgi:hypothetical protein
MSAGATPTVKTPPTDPVVSGGVIRIARYSVYPRVASEHSVQTGFTRDLSGKGIHLVTTTPELVGELLRIRIQNVGELDAHETLARVVDCDRSGEGRFELTLEALDAHRPRFVRHARG